MTEIFKSIKKQNWIFFIISILHFIFVFYNTMELRYSDFLPNQKIFFIFVKCMSFLFIVGFWQFVSFLVDEIIHNKQYKNDFIRYFLSYFILNLIVLVLTFPVMLYEISMPYAFCYLVNYILLSHPSWLQSANMTIAYNVLPFSFGPSICNSFLYSLIFAYCISSAKSFCSKKNYWFLISIFCFPWILVLNQYTSRMIFVSWLFVFVIAFIIFNQNNKINKFVQTFLFSIVSGLLVSIRTEYIFLLVLIPLMVFFYKVFSLKKYFVFLILFSSLFLFCFGIQKKLEGYEYEINNLSYVYEYYVKDNMYDAEIEKNKELLDMIYKDYLKKPTLKINESVCESETILAVKLLIKFVFKNPFYFINKNIYYFIRLKDEIFDFTEAEKFARTNLQKDRMLPSFLIPEYKFQHKFSSFLLYFNLNNKANIFSKMLYNPLVASFLLFVSFIISFFIKRNFTVWLVFALFPIMVITLLFMKYHLPFYFHSFILNSWFIFALSIMFLLEKQKNRV